MYCLALAHHTDTQTPSGGDRVGNKGDTRGKEEHLDGRPGRRTDSMSAFNH